MNKYLAKELKKWHKILEQDGFRDYEYTNESGLFIQALLLSSWTREKIKAWNGYARQKAEFLRSYQFTKPFHKLIWAYHCRGYSYKEIHKRMIQYLPSLSPNTYKSKLVNADPVRKIGIKHSYIRFSSAYLHSIVNGLRPKMVKFFRDKNSYNHVYKENRYNPVYKRTTNRHVDSIEGFIESTKGLSSASDLQKLELKKLFKKLGTKSE